VSKRILRYTTIAAAALALTTLGACKAKQGSETAAGTEYPAAGDTGMATGRAMDTAASGSAEAGALTDPNIFALLDEVNKGDSAAAAYALTKTTNPDVKAFAKLMMGEHHALRAQGQQLAQKLNVTPQPPANDPVQALGQSEMEALQAAPKGPQFDRAYLEQEVAIHKAALDLAGKAHDTTQNQELKSLIEKAKPVYERHLEKAEEIQKKLGKPTA
jgi:putative membrane protein